MYLARCIELLESEFPENWLEEYLTFDEITGEQDLNADFNHKISFLIKEYSDYFIKSIIIGEYVKDVEFKSYLQKASEIIQRSFYVDIERQNNAVFEYLNDVQQTLNDFIDKYLGFQKNISSYNSNSNSLLVFRVEKPNKPNKYSLDLFKIFSSFAGLYSFEHFLNEKFFFIKHIVEIENNIEEIISSDNEYYQIFRAKVIFLKFKLLFRYKINLENDSEYPQIFADKSYVIDNVEHSLHKMPTNPVQYKTLKIWEEYLINHYRKDLDSQYYSSKYAEIKEVDISNRTILDLHFCIKYFKDVNKDKGELIAITSEIEKRHKLYSNDFIYSKIYLYSLNNLLSYYCDNNSSDIEISNLYAKIESLQSKIQNKNFFGSLKLLEKKSEITFSEIESNKDILAINIGIGKLEEIQNLIDKCKSKIEWSESHQNLVFQLSYTESLVDVKDLNLPVDVIYFPSSFILPIAMKENKKKLTSLSEKFNQNRLRIELYNSLQPNLRELHNAKEEIKDIQKKTIETMTIFTAIISFIVGSTGAFEFIKTFWQSILFLILFAVCISIFVLLVFASTKGLDALKKHWYIGIPYVFISIFIFIVAIPNYQKETSKFTTEQHKQLDHKLKLMKKEIKSSLVDSINFSKVVNSKN